MSSSQAPTSLVLLVVILATIVAAVDADAKEGLQTISWAQPKSEITSLIRNKRQYEYAIPAKETQQTAKKYQECIAPGSKPGHCKHLSSCKEDAFRSNFATVFQYACVIEKEFIGVCCPDDESSTGENDVLPVKGLAGSLPAVAADKEIFLEEKGDTRDRDSRVSRGCGMSTREANRVTGGHLANVIQWPWIAALIYKFNREQFCGGVLITDRHVLTAAHCTQPVKPKHIFVRLGEYDLRYPNETRALDFNVTEIRIHKDFILSTYAHDISIVKIVRPTIFNTYIWPVCLPPVGIHMDNKHATVIGWGATSFGGSASYILKEVTIPVWPLDKCAPQYTQEITTNHICAGAPEGNGDACQGDSGGPLLHQLSNGRWVTVGVVSWGIGCGNADKPGIYTRVSSYLDWIFANAVF